MWPSPRMTHLWETRVARQRRSRAGATHAFEATLPRAGVAPSQPGGGRSGSRFGPAQAQSDAASGAARARGRRLALVQRRVGGSSPSAGRAPRRRLRSTRRASPSAPALRVWGVARGTPPGQRAGAGRARGDCGVYGDNPGSTHASAEHPFGDRAFRIHYGTTFISPECSGAFLTCNNRESGSLNAEKRKASQMTQRKNLNKLAGLPAGNGPLVAAHRAALDANVASISTDDTEAPLGMLRIANPTTH